MAFQLLSLPPQALLTAFQEAAQPLLYPSETDAPIVVQTYPATTIGTAFSSEDIERLFYTAAGKPLPQSISQAEVHRTDSVGTRKFFRELLDVITTYPNNEIYFHEAYHREQVPQWRRLHNLIFDNLIHGRWFRTELPSPDKARKDIFVVGQHVAVEVNPDTNEMRTQPLDWIVLTTYVIET